MKTVLSYGMGVDSTAILVEWLTNPSSRDFDLEDLIVLTSQVGDEFESTKRLIEDHVLPLMRQHNVRWVQVARATECQTDGYAVLSDTRQPTTVYLEGSYKLSTELLDAGTIPTSGMCRKCSLKAKGWVLDLWIEKNITGDFRHVMGFNADELRRVEKDSSYSKVERKSEYPLVGWKWGRVKCEEYLQDWCGERWEKSCCGYCPFAGQNKAGRGDLLRRFRDEPDHAMLALKMEQAALALNARMKLYSSKSVRSVIKADTPDLVDRFDEDQAKQTWALYHIRRVFLAKANAKRALEIIEQGSKSEMQSALRCKAKHTGLEVTEDNGGVLTMQVSLKSQEIFPCREESWVAAPMVAKSKINGSQSGSQGSPTGFYKYWPLAETINPCKPKDPPCTSPDMTTGKQPSPSEIQTASPAETPVSVRTVVVEVAKSVLGLGNALTASLRKNTTP
jgi:hypothetical protein